MTLRIQIIVIACMLVAILYIVSLARKKKIDYKYALVWIFVAILVLLMAAFPDVLGLLAGLLGIATPVNMLFFLGFIFSLMIIFTLSRTVSDLSNKIKKLSQEIAILKRDFHIENKEDE